VPEGDRGAEIRALGQLLQPGDPHDLTDALIWLPG
jgi:hypothetical protein